MVYTGLINSGFNGAAHISAYLLHQYGKDSIEFIIDEGGSEVKHLYGAIVALPATAEKVSTPLINR